MKVLDFTDHADLTISHFLDTAADVHGDRPFISEGQVSLSYNQFRNLSRQAAAHLSSYSIGKGDRVALLLGNSIWHLAAWFGIIRLGAIAAPLNIRLAPIEIERSLKHLEPRLVLAGTEQEAVPRRLGLPVLHPQVLAEPAGEPASVSVKPKDPAAFILTSGSTGAPKAVMQTHQTYVLTGQAFPSWIGLEQRDRMLVVLPLHHINAQAYSVMGAIGAGASIVLAPRFSPRSFWDDCRRWGITQFNAVGAVVRILAAQSPQRIDSDNPVRLCYTALALPESEHRAFEERFGLRMTVGYGLSESTYGTVWPREGPRIFGSIGMLRQHPWLGEINEARVIDDTGCPVQPGEPGELLLHNPATMLGYFRAPEETAEALRSGWLHTGDLVTHDGSGVFRFVSRKKDLIRHKGENIAPAEIENVLLQHEGVLEAAVIGVPSTLGEDDIEAHIVLQPHAMVSVETLRQWCLEHLASYKVPLTFVLHDALPRTQTQRIAKHELRRSQPS